MSLHEPVLTREVVSFLAPSQGGTYVDCTVGLGGHARALLESGASEVIGIDRDAEALDEARRLLAEWGDRVVLIHGDYRDLPALCAARGLESVDGMVADLGLSSFQLAAEGRGFSFQRDDPLDMRMDRSRGRTVAELMAAASETELADVIFRYGEERYSRRIARAVGEAMRGGGLETTRALASVIRRAIPSRGYARIDPATRTFQALRIWTNGELDGLDQFLRAAAERLRPNRRLAVITFHSLEDRIVKHTFRALQQGGEAGVTVLTRKPVVPGEQEVAANPRSRSAKLRAIEKRG